MRKLSAYVLTCNSERHLDDVLNPLSQLVDDLIIVDSGSTDSTLEIAARYGCRIEHRALDTFQAQREFARSLCANDWILTLDSDEVPSPDLVAALKRFNPDDIDDESVDGFMFARHWYAFGKPVRAVFPVTSPDHVARLYHRDRLQYDNAYSVHERPVASNRLKLFKPGHLSHYTLDTEEEMRDKLDRYTSLAADDMYRRGRQTNPLRTTAAAVVAFIKWYLLKQGFRDGLTGLRLSIYASRSTGAKYRKLGQLTRSNGSSGSS